MRNQFFLAASVAMLLFGNVAAADDSLLKELLAEETKVYEALKNNDHDGLAKLLAYQKPAILRGADPMYSAIGPRDYISPRPYSLR